VRLARTVGLVGATWLLLLASATAAQAGGLTPDPAAIQKLPTDRNGSGTCGGYTVAWTHAPPRSRGETGQATIRVSGGAGTDKAIVEPLASAGEGLLPLWCGDILGDGSTALAYERFSGGAHCCFTLTVVTLGPDGRQLLQVDMGNAGGLEPEQLSGDGPLQLRSSSDVFAYFDDLPFVASPFLPMIFRYDGSRYVEATTDYPGYLRAQLDEARNQLAGLPAQVPVAGGPDLAELEHQSIALRAYGLSVLLGEPDAGLARLDRQLSPPVAAWLDAHAAEALDLLGHRYRL
jgi:hypothetical protein